jgi:Secretion system C-terminal sorting domain
MKHKFLICFCLCLQAVFAQKDCNKNNRDYIPLTDLGQATYKGFSGGLYAGGSNKPSGAFLQELLSRANAIRPLDSNGQVSNSGKIVFIGVGASNPRTEFAAFQQMLDTFRNVNPALITVNTCIGGQGVQKMNDPADNYWKSAAHMYDSMQVHPNQVQVAWIETENTQKGDTVFPAAPMALVQDLRILLQTLKQKYPNLKLCYLSARAYSGWANSGMGKGLEHPRDYFNGWACKWLIDSAAAGKSGFVYSGSAPEIPMPVYATYMWTNKGDVRNDGFSIDCSTDIGNDGLHLSAAGEQKLGKLIFDFFSKDNSSAPWFLAQNTSGVAIQSSAGSGILVYPNPASTLLSIRFPEPAQRSVKLINVLMQEIQTLEGNAEQMQIDLSALPAGIYWIVCTGPGSTGSVRFLKQ